MEVDWHGRVHGKNWNQACMRSQPCFDWSPRKQDCEQPLKTVFENWLVPAPLDLEPAMNLSNVWCGQVDEVPMRMSWCVLGIVHLSVFWVVCGCNRLLTNNIVLIIRDMSNQTCWLDTADKRVHKRFPKKFKSLITSQRLENRRCTKVDMETFIHF